jgi:hypothetical protein
MRQVCSAALPELEKEAAKNKYYFVQGFVSELPASEMENNNRYARDIYVLRRQ